MEANLQELLKAENEVNRMVQDALNKKNILLRGIKESSERDIKAFKDQREREYQEQLKELKAQIEKEANAGKTELVSMTIERDYEANKDKVVELLVRNVLSVNIEIPKVVKGTF
jgi:vacuolar-type H+-ATPase subunit H